jgi:hypothetical protein
MSRVAVNAQMRNVVDDRDIEDNDGIHQTNGDHIITRSWLGKIGLRILLWMIGGCACV